MASMIFADRWTDSQPGAVNQNDVDFVLDRALIGKPGNRRAAL